MHNKKLSEILFNYPCLNQFHDTPISGIAVDSRLVKPGDLFVATSDRVDGHQYISGAIKNGAAAVLGSQADISIPVPYVQVADARAAMAALSANYYEHPENELTLIGVTGTDGKTSTVNLIFQILRKAGFKAGMISTVSAIIGEEALDTGLHVTTPEVFDLYRYLRMMVNAGLTHAVLETTSHGLAAKRVLGEIFDIGVVTNITHEHLDYHGSYAAYFEAKAKLFLGLGHLKNSTHAVPMAVLNKDDRSFKPLAELVKVPALSYSMKGPADLSASHIVNSAESLSFRVTGKNFEMDVRSTLVGNYNVSNCLAAIAATVNGLGVEPEIAKAAIEAFQGVPGRMERIDSGQNFIAIVDFAHTPYAIQAVLEAARTICTKTVFAVFGSAGLRDKEKRRMMAEIASQLADISVFTAEDPRTESLSGILEEMSRGAIAKGGIEGSSFFRIPDRRQAIRKVVSMAQPGDLVLILGKGHEQSMCFEETEYPWDDRTALKAALAERLGQEGPEMPFLPS